jgi:ElaA protein
MENSAGLTWLCKTFDQLTVSELYAILQARNDVFIVEQFCHYRDIDNKDQRCLHLMGLLRGELAAYARIIPPGISYREASIGRVLSTQLFRRQGMGILLMENAIEQLFLHFGEQEIRIGAQLYLKNFYEQFHFVQVSATYLEDNIPHIEMLRKV